MTSNARSVSTPHESEWAREGSMKGSNNSYMHTCSGGGTLPNAQRVNPPLALLLSRTRTNVFGEPVPGVPLVLAFGFRCVWTGHVHHSRHAGSAVVCLPCSLCASLALRSCRRDMCSSSQTARGRSRAPSMPLRRDAGTRRAASFCMATSRLLAAFQPSRSPRQPPRPSRRQQL